MNKTTKGAVAAAAGAVLLLGGAGSLAYWTGTQDVGSVNDIKSGTFTLSAPDCTTGTGTHDWQIDGGAAYDTSMLLSPGDTISKVCDLTLVMSGAHVAADLGIDTAALTDTGSTTLDTELTPSASFTVDGTSAVTSVTGAGTYTIQATVTITFDGPSATNASQLGDVDLDAINVTATQKHVA